MNWNVRGLNAPARRATVKELVVDTRCSLLCLQETKLAAITPGLAAEIAGASLQGTAFKRADEIRGGILVCWDQSLMQMDNVLTLNRSITMCVNPLDGVHPWSLTVVYGPHTDQEKQAFIEEIKQIHDGIVRPWLIIEDFNLIYQALDKNN